MNIRKTITSEIEWNTIKKAQADGKLQELLQVGDGHDGERAAVRAEGLHEGYAQHEQAHEQQRRLAGL